jgi:hypothetical protein
MTHPGVGPPTALAYVLIIGTSSRFPRGKQIAVEVRIEEMFWRHRLSNPETRKDRPNAISGANGPDR